MADQEAGYQIAGKFFPFPTSFRLGDPVLIRDLTGLTWDEFLRAMPDEDDPEDVGDPVVLLGMLGVAVWQANPTWRRDKVARYVQNIPIEDVEAVGVEEEQDGDAGPPEMKKDGSKGSKNSPARSSSDSGSPSEPSNQKPSGSLLSVTTPG